MCGGGWVLKVVGTMWLLSFFFFFFFFGDCCKVCIVVRW